MTRFLYALGRFCARHRVPVLAVWLRDLRRARRPSRAASATDQRQPHAAGHRQPAAPPTCSTTSSPSRPTAPNPIVLRRARRRQARPTPSYEDAITSVYDGLHEGHAAVQTAVSPFSSDGRGPASKDKTIGYISLTLKDSPSDLSIDEAQDILDVADPAKAAGLQVVGRRLPGPEAVQAVDATCPRSSASPPRS